MLALYHGEPNLFSLAPLIALHEKGLAFDSHFVDWTQAETTANATGDTIEAAYNLEFDGPVLIHDGKVITDSFFALEYLDDAFPALRLKPGTPYGDWQVQVWGRFLGERVAPAVTTLGLHAFVAPQLKKTSAELTRIEPLERRTAWTDAFADNYPASLIDESQRRAGMLIDRIEAALAGDRSWLVEDQYGLADIAAFALANSLPKLLPARCAAAPRTTDWLERMRGRPAVRQALSVSRTGVPDEAFALGPEHARWG